ncbi:MAG TPA: PaaI family thioesterase [Candidatus Blautia intestinigallinarum]|nr:PaaI family thioesterase [Candidatus Blautia intestinigallinarum]
MDYEKLIQFRDEGNHFTRKLGIQTVEIREGYAKVKLAVEKDHTNFLGSVHGGCLFSIADSVAGAAASSYGDYSTTVNASINYLVPALQVKELTGEARVIKHGKRISVFQVQIRNDEGKLLVQGEFTYYDMGKKIFQEEQ